jgi:hypothetical protein
MSISERARYDLYAKLEQLLGPDEATTLMEHLPPVGWADVATTRDLDALEERMELRFEAMEHRFETTVLATGHGLRTELADRVSEAVRTMVLASVSSVLATAALAFGAARL